MRTMHWRSAKLKQFENGFPYPVYWNDGNGFQCLTKVVKVRTTTMTVLIGGWKHRLSKETKVWDNSE